MRAVRCALAAVLVWGAAEFPAGAAAAPPAKPDRGYTYIHDEVAEVPWSIHIFKIELSHREFELHTASGLGETIGMSTVPSMVKMVPKELGQPVAAVNGDFYSNSKRYRGRPLGLQIRHGELVSAPGPHLAAWIDLEGKPHMTNVVSCFQVTWSNGITTPFGLNTDRRPNTAVLYTSSVGRTTRTVGGTEYVLEPVTNSCWLPLAIGRKMTARVKEYRSGGDVHFPPETMVLSLGPVLASQLPAVEVGDIVQISTDTIPNLTGVQTAVGGNPTLVLNSVAMQWTGIQPRHPRTAIGWNKDYLFLVEVDGRQRGLSVGMTFPELAAYMVKIGCEQAMNLDGGGSSTMWVNGNTMNSPSEGRERPAANALVVVKKRAAVTPAKTEAGEK
jgi:large repetitive protein